MKTNPALKYFCLFVLLSPGIWQIGMHTKEALQEWLSFPVRISQNLKSKSTSNFFVYIEELRWGGRQLHRNDLKSRVTYNKSIGLLNEGFDFLQFATPKLYFASGDGSIFSPSRIEPIPSLLFPLWIAGIVGLLKHRRFKVFLILGLSLLPSFLAGSKNLSLLLPVLLTHIYISAFGLTNLFVRPSTRVAAASLLSIYGLYVVSMNFWFNR